MSALEQQQRQKVIAEAMSWLDTPYKHEARVKGAGVDCAQLLIGVFAGAGLIEPFRPERYPPDWQLNSAGERFLPVVERFADPIEGSPQPGDVVVWKFGLSFSHGGIVLEWPRVIHSLKPRRVTIDDAVRAGWLTTVFEIRADRGKPRERRLYSYWARQR